MEKLATANKPATTAKPASTGDWNSQRWAGITRTYGPAEVQALRGTVRVEHSLARAGAEKLWRQLRSEALHCSPGRAHRQSGSADGSGRPESDLS